MTAGEAEEFEIGGCAGAPFAAPAPAAPSVAQNYAPVSPSAPARSSCPSQPREPRKAVRAPMSADRADRAALAEQRAQAGDTGIGRRAGRRRATALLLDQGAAFDARDEAGRTPLMLAVPKVGLRLCACCWQRGADPNAADEAGQTPLQQAQKRICGMSPRCWSRRGRARLMRPSASGAAHRADARLTLQRPPLFRRWR